MIRFKKTTQIQSIKTKYGRPSYLFVVPSYEEISFSATLYGHVTSYTVPCVWDVESQLCPQYYKALH